MHVAHCIVELITYYVLSIVSYVVCSLWYPVHGMQYVIFGIDIQNVAWSVRYVLYKYSMTDAPM